MTACTLKRCTPVQVRVVLAEFESNRCGAEDKKKKAGDTCAMGARQRRDVMRFSIQCSSSAHPEASRPTSNPPTTNVTVVSRADSIPHDVRARNRDSNSNGMEEKTGNTCSRRTCTVTNCSYTYFDVGNSKRLTARTTTGRPRTWRSPHAANTLITTSAKGLAPGANVEANKNKTARRPVPRQRLLHVHSPTTRTCTSLCRGKTSCRVDSFFLM